MPTVSGTLNAVYTTLARAKYALKSGNLTSASPPLIPSAGVLTYASYFKVGLGGWNPDGSPRTPDPDLTDLDIIIDQSRANRRYPLITNPPYTNYYFQKAVGTMSASNNQLLVPCTLTTAEYNNDGVGSPSIWEIGIFDTDNVMLVYGTFSGITKTSAKSVAFPNYLIF